MDGVDSIRGEKVRKRDAIEKKMTDGRRAKSARKRGR